MRSSNYVAHYEIIYDEVGDAGLFVVLYIMNIIWGMYISRVVFINASGHQNIFSPLFRLKEGQNIRTKQRVRKTRKKRKLKIQTNEGQQLIIPPELYRSFQRCPPPDLHQQCLNLIRLRALEQAHCYPALWTSFQMVLHPLGCWPSYGPELESRNRGVTVVCITAVTGTWWYCITAVTGTCGIQS